MNTTTQINSVDDFRRQSDLDFILSARIGLLVQILGWLLIVILTGFYSKQPLLTLQLSWLIIVISLLRFTHIALHQYFYASSSRIWMATHYFLLLLQALFWSGFYVYQINLDALSPVLLASILMLAVDSNGAIFSMRSKLVMTQIYLVLMLLPAAAMSFGQDNLQFLAYLLIAYWMYLLAFALRCHKHYILNHSFQLSLMKNKQDIDSKDKIDSLTKIYNRHYFEDCFEYQWQLAIRNSTEIALLMIDIDHFKTINEAHGQEFGDQCLVHIADVIRQSAKRQTDMVIRYAGEEFVLILPDTEQAAALKLAEVIRHNLEFEEFQCGDDSHTITASIGVGVVQPKQFSSPTLLLQIAEMALFQAKIHGRNRVELG